MTRRNRLARARRMRSLTPYKPIQSIKRSVIHSAPHSFFKFSSQATLPILSVRRSLSQSLDQSTMPIHVVFDSEPETEPIGRVDPLTIRSVNSRKRSRAPALQPTRIVFTESSDDNDSSLSSEDSDLESASEDETEVEHTPKRRRWQNVVNDSGNESTESFTLAASTGNSQHAELSDNRSTRRWSRHMELSIRSDPSQIVQESAETNSSSCNYDADASDDEEIEQSTKPVVRLYRQPSIILPAGNHLFNQSLIESDFSRSLSLPLSSMMQSPVESSPRYVQFSVSTHRSLSQPSWMMSNDDSNKFSVLDSDREDDLEHWSDQDTDAYETDECSSDVVMFSPAHSSCETTDELPDSESAYHEYSMPAAVQLSDHYSDEDGSDDEHAHRDGSTTRSTESSITQLVHHPPINPPEAEVTSTTGRVKTLLRRAGIGMLFVAGAVPWAAALADYAGLDCGIGL